MQTSPKTSIMNHHILARKHTSENTIKWRLESTSLFARSCWSSSWKLHRLLLWKETVMILLPRRCPLSAHSWTNMIEWSRGRGRGDGMETGVTGLTLGGAIARCSPLRIESAVKKNLPRAWGSQALWKRARKYESYFATAALITVYWLPCFWLFLIEYPRPY